MSRLDAMPDAVRFEQVSLFMDISALMEINWTGIANVTANLARELHRHFPRNSYFFFRDRIVDPLALLAAIDKAPGAYLEVLLNYGYSDLGHIADFIGRRPLSVGIFPNIKSAHRFFDIELVILHDLSAMLMPELHQQWAADLHTTALSRDVQSSDLVCCVSEATRQDAIAYLGLDPNKSFVSHLGVHRPPILDEPPPPHSNYALVLGTIEPRKNLRLVAEFLQCRPDLAQRLAMIFAGRRGWGPAFDQVFGDLLQEPPWSKRVIFTDFLQEADKWTLMRGARFAIFPSLFEGFGLPVIECMAAGCPVIVSRSSSLIEFDLPDEMYFDPFSVADFSRAFRFIDSMPESARAALGQDLQIQARKYTWDACFKRIVKALATKISFSDQPASSSVLQGASVRNRKKVLQ